MHPKVGCAHLGLSWAAVRSGAIDKARVHAAFRSESRWCHPDSHSRRSRSAEDFCVLVEARECVLTALSEVASRQSGEKSAVWLQLSGQIREDMLRRTRDHILSDAMTHPMYVRLATLVDETGFREHVRSCLAEYYDRKADAVRVVHVNASVDGILRGDVFVHEPLNRGTKLFVPLWHDSVWFEEEGLVFVIDLMPCAVEAHIHDAADRDCVKTIECRTRQRACSKEKREFVDLEIVIGVSRSGWMRRSAADTIELHVGGEVFRVSIPELDTEPGTGQIPTGPSYYPGRGIYARDDSDIFSTEQRSDVEVRIVALE